MIDDRSHYLIIVEEARCRILPSLCTLSTLDKVFYFIAGVRAYFPGRMRVPEPDERNAPQILPRHGLWVCECEGACVRTVRIEAPSCFSSLVILEAVTPRNVSAPAVDCVRASVDTWSPFSQLGQS